MNCNQAKNIDIVDFLNSKGYAPERINNTSCWYNLRNEKTASLKVEKKLNVFYDYGTAKGGKLVDLVLCYFTNNDIKKALEYIGSNEIITNCNNNTNIVHVEQNITITKIKDISNIALVNYLHSRKICKHYNLYLKEIYYTIENKPYFALFWLNDSGGYELRNKYYKGCLQKKDITTVPPSSATGGNLNIFEGMFDFLSYLQINELINKTIVLNSLCNLDKITGIEKYAQVNVYFDNDTAGKEAVQNLKKLYKNITDMSYIYANYKDYNDYLINT